VNRTIIDKLKEISEIIINFNDYSKYGLLGGSLGEILFLYYYYKLTKNNFFIRKANEKLEKTISEINNKDNLLFSFGKGLTGFLWMIFHLRKNNFIYFHEENFNSYDNILVDLMKNLILQGEYDYLHKALGICLLYISKNRYYSELFISVNNLNKTKLNCIEQNKICWEYHLRSANKMVVNLGLSHGLASIITILSKERNLMDSYNLIDELINNSINFLLSTKNSSSNNSLFPNHVYKNGKPISNKARNSRLAWCYGDLGISVAIWHASQAFGRKDWEEEAIINILLHSAKRRDLKENRVVDAGLCHDTVGIASVWDCYVTLEKPLTQAQSTNLRI